MIVKLEHRKKILDRLFREGVMLVKKDWHGTHPILNIPNAEVMYTFRSLKSRELVDVVFNWQHSYYTITNKGIEVLREMLHLPEDSVPVTDSKLAAHKMPMMDAKDKKEELKSQ